MTVQTSNDEPIIYPNPQNPVWVDEEIDLRQYFQTLINWRLEIFALATGAALLVSVALLALRLLSTPFYESAATVAIARVSSDITFDERFRTQSDETLAAQRANTDARRASLVGLVKSGGVAQAVIAELGDRLEKNETAPDVILEMIEAAIVPGRTANIESDLIRITATADSPQKAAAIANAWARNYVLQVNAIYGQMPAEVLESIDTEVNNSEAQYQTAQSALEEFLANNQVKILQRLIDEKRGIINSLQVGKQTAVDTIVSEELKARSDVISAYIQALSANRLLAFTKEQEGKQAIIEAYIDAQVQSRLHAVEKDREARETFFNHLTDAQLASTTAVFDQQVQSRIDRLRQLYAQQNRLQTLLGQAQLLQDQIQQGGEDAVASNALALALLKAQVMVAPELPPSEDIFQPEPAAQRLIIEQPTAQPTQPAVTTAATPQPPVVNVPVVSAPVVNVQGDAAQPRNQVQINVDVAAAAAADAAGQRQDVAGLIGALEDGLTQLDTRIQSLSQTLLTGNDYQMLDQMMASELGISGAISDTLPAASDQAESTDLSQRVAQRYLDLFDVGGLAADAEPLTADSALFAKIRELYPELFTPGDLSALAEEIPADNPLAVLSVTKAQELLQLQGLEDIPSYTAAAEPLIQAINKLDTEIQGLEAQLESESARQRQLTQLRDLAWETFKTLSTKKAELDLAQSATNSEVRLAAPAVEPIEPIQGPSLLMSIPIAGIVGLMLGIFVAFIASFMGHEPFLRRRQTDPAAASA